MISSNIKQLKYLCEKTWNACYPDRKKWADIGEEAQAEWLRVFEAFQSLSSEGRIDEPSPPHWVKEHPKPNTQDWYWWRPFSEGVEKVFEIYRTERFGIESWVLCHPYGEMDIGIALKRWPHSEWSSVAIQRPNAPTVPTAD